jgi:hypothetical protein
MTRDGTVGRSDATEPNLRTHRDIDPARMMRTRFADSIRASSPSGLHQKAGHMTASDSVLHAQRSLARRGPSTHECARQSWCDPAGGSPAQVRSSVRLVASVAWPPATGLRSVHSNCMGCRRLHRHSDARRVFGRCSAVLRRCYFARLQTRTAEFPPTDGAGLVYFSSSPVIETLVLF